MRAYVNAAYCVGCGLCCTNAPEVFRMNDDGTAEAYADTTDANRADVEEAIDSCPLSAIRAAE